MTASLAMKDTIQLGELLRGLPEALLKALSESPLEKRQTTLAAGMHLDCANYQIIDTET